MIEEEAEKRGDIIVFCPKFHPELSPIESAYRDVAKTLRQENIVGSSKGYAMKMHNDDDNRRHHRGLNHSQQQKILSLTKTERRKEGERMEGRRRD